MYHFLSNTEKIKKNQPLVDEQVAGVEDGECQTDDGSRERRSREEAGGAPGERWGTTGGLRR